MSNPFFDHPILNSPYERPSRHWELDESGQPTQKRVETRRTAQFITPIPKPKKRKNAVEKKSTMDTYGIPVLITSAATVARPLPSSPRCIRSNRTSRRRLKPTSTR